MSVLHAIILGAIQGLTEFIPVSSSGHLVAVPHLLGWAYQGKSFDAALHLGTLLALLLYFWADWLKILASFHARIFKGRPYEKDTDPGASGRLLVPIVVASIPAAVVGFALKNVIEGTPANPDGLNKWYYVAFALVVFGLVMLAAEWIGKKKRGIESMNYVDYLVIGLSQAVALFPGVSRSGITISAGLFRDLDRTAAARFSFLLSTPAVLGAGLFALKDALEEGFHPGELSAFIWGMCTAAIFGVVAIKFLMAFLKKRPMTVFVIYRVCLAAGLVAVFAPR